jgi:hypothetical protein
MRHRTEYVAFRCSDQERRALERLAKRRGQNLSETVRGVIQAEAKRAGVRVTTEGGRRDAPDET